MGETSDQIERHIQETRNDLGDNLSELQDKVKTAVDWRAQFEERPGTMLALAFGGGIVLSALLPSGRRSRSTYDDGWKAATNRDLTPSLQSANSSQVCALDFPIVMVCSDAWDIMASRHLYE